MSGLVKNIISFILLMHFYLMLGCSDYKENSNNEPTLKGGVDSAYVVDDRLIAKRDSVIRRYKIQLEGLKELELAGKIIDTAYAFPNSVYDSIVVYELDRNGNHSWEDSAFYSERVRAIP